MSRFTPEQIEEAKRLILTVEQARDAYPYHESVTPMDIAGHTLHREDVRMSYKALSSDDVRKILGMGA